MGRKPLHPSRYNGLKTTFNITKSTHEVAVEICKKTGVTYTYLQHKALEYFLAGERKINPRLLITAYTDPWYIHRDYRDAIILTRQEKEEIEKLAEETRVMKTTILFQAMLDFCSLQAQLLWSDEELEEIFDFGE